VEAQIEMGLGFKLFWAFPPGIEDEMRPLYDKVFSANAFSLNPLPSFSHFRELTPAFNGAVSVELPQAEIVFSSTFLKEGTVLWQYPSVPRQASS